MEGYGNQFKAPDHLAALQGGIAPAQPPPNVLGNRFVDAPTQVGNIPEALACLDSLSANLQDEIRSLESRLGPFLRPDNPPSTAQSGQAPRPTPSQMAGGLRELESRLRGALEHVRSLNARVDF